MSFKIDFFSEDQNSKISLGPRKLGEAGKDIIVVKLVLGLLKPLGEDGNYVADELPEELAMEIAQARDRESASATACAIAFATAFAIACATA